MSNKIFHWTNTFKALGETDDGGIDIKGSASTNALDRAGDLSNQKHGQKVDWKTIKVILFYFLIMTIIDLSVEQQG